MEGEQSTSGQQKAITAETLKQKYSLEYWLTRATDPFLDSASSEGNDARTEFIGSFCDGVNEELEGPQIACRLLAHKIQSPNEHEALNALRVIDACVKQCGPRFHNEMSKFRFLNELIKILSPKYMGEQTPAAVKRRAIELLYWWQNTLRHLPKLKQAYQMLKEQNVVTQDPTYMDQLAGPGPPPPAPRVASFEDEEKSKLLSQLLKSTNPEDLQAANRLIKSMVKVEDQKMERVSKRCEDIDQASNNATLLSEMVGNFTSEPSAMSEDEKEIMKELAESLQHLRPTLFRYAGEAAETDERALAEVLLVNDEVNRVIEDYKKHVEPHISIKAASSTSTISAAGAADGQRDKASALLSLLNFDAPSASSTKSAVDDVFMLASSSNPSQISVGYTQPTNNLPPSSNDDVGMIMGTVNSPSPSVGSGGDATVAPKHPPLSGVPLKPNAIELADIFSGSATANSASNDPYAALARHNLKSPEEEEQQGVVSSNRYTAKPFPKALLELEELSNELIQQHLVPIGKASISQNQRITQQQRTKVPLRDLMSDAGNNDISPTSSELVDIGDYGERNIGMDKSPSPAEQRKNDDNDVGASLKQSVTESVENESVVKQNGASPVTTTDSLVTSSSSSSIPLEDVNVPFQEIKPGSRPPMVVLDRNGLKIVLHHTANRPAVDVSVFVMNVTSALTDTALNDVKLELRAPEMNCQLRSQTPTGETLPAFNPVFPQTAVSQILLIGAKQVDKALLDYTLSYTAKAEHAISGSFEVALNRD